jgi:hypothetical protein
MQKKLITRILNKLFIASTYVCFPARSFFDLVGIKVEKHTYSALKKHTYKVLKTLQDKYSNRKDLTGFLNLLGLSEE